MHDNDLDWLARNVHKWRDGANFICVDHNNGGFVFHEHDRNCAVWFSREQWLARRAELQNKPNWDEAKEWAGALVQGNDGAWWWFEYIPEVCERTWSYPGMSLTSKKKGEVLGDWRDTLERRPDAVKQFARIEYNQEGSMGNQMDWFERGGLPPFGVAVQLWHGGSYAYDCEIIARRGGDYVLWNLTWERADSADCMMCEFRPLPTERERAISEMVAIMKGETAGLVLFKDGAAKLYDSGYRKESK